ncbi:STAS-like domain-containing protein [Flavobacteriaceae bacterium XHP0103]|jgi:hypothetical protein|uniref:STAS-like domain-containing protein n=1 Tax=Marixanthotalea marina TaxID=2844359 RepID=UPI002989EFA8|nr:STAS-like domain-containing protein [Marixanthotalea marina]MBU3822502.1 STAS-like domain-containing protein [Marixanthotalea marina]
MQINFGHINSSLGTRVLGKKLRLEIEESLRNDGFVIFNFEGVNTVSHSFADECFGKLLLSWNIEELKAKSTFQNTNALIKKTVAFTLKERASEMALA